MIEKLLTNKIWSTREFWIIATIVCVNPLIVAAINFIFGFQFLLGIIAGITAFVAIKTDWKRSK